MPAQDQKKSEMIFDDEIIEPSRKSTEPSRLIFSEINLQEQPISQKIGDNEAPEEEVEEEEINQQPRRQARVMKAVKKIKQSDKRITKILKPIQEEGAQGSASSSHYKHVFKRCH